MNQDHFGRINIPEYDTEVPVLAIGEYKKDQGEDEFSRKQVWFYVYGEDEIKEEFKDKLGSLINSRFVEDDINWDLMTLYPTHAKGEVNPQMRDLLESLSADTGIKYQQVLERTQQIRENHELDSRKAKAVNLEGSIDVKDFDGKNVIIFDNIALSGTSIAHGAEKLMEAGAENVFGVVLGLSSDFPEKKMENRDKKASSLMEGS